MFDLIIRNAKIVDGTGNPWFKGDVAIAKGTIKEVGLLKGAIAGREIDAAGKVLCPGFVDGHSHSDLFVLTQPESRLKILQGCTTENVGLDGMSVGPINDADKESWKTHLSGLAGRHDVAWTWNTLGDYFDAVDAATPAVNICSYVGLGTVRRKVMGMADGIASAADMAAMERLVEEAMQQGARGVSAGLIYPPSQFQSTEEMVALSKVAARYDGVYDVHMRNESDTIDQAMDEVIEIGRQSGIRILITHFKVRGKKNWGRSTALLEKLDKTRAQGVDVTIAQYPYTAGSTFLHALIPPWYHAGGIPAFLKALENQIDDIHRDILTRFDWENIPQSLGWDNIIISSVEKEANRDCEGKSVAEVAAMRGDRDEVAAVCRLLVEEQLAVGMILFGLDEQDVRNIMQHPTMSVITDGLLSGSNPHPRAVATYPRVLGRYCRQEKVLTLEEAVRKMTSLPADKLKLKQKGLIRCGFDADLVIFDEQTVLDTNSYENSLVPPAGIEYVFVHGQTAVEKGQQTLARAGKTIRSVS